MLKKGRRNTAFCTAGVQAATSSSGGGAHTERSVAVLPATVTSLLGRAVVPQVTKVHVEVLLRGVLRVLGAECVVTVKIMPGLLNLLIVAMGSVLLALRTHVLGELVKMHMTSIELLLRRRLLGGTRSCSRKRVVPPVRVEGFRNDGAQEKRHGPHSNQWASTLTALLVLWAQTL